MVKFLATCALVEDKAALIYRAMGETAMAAQNEELGRLWQAMAADEEDHGQQVRLAARLSREHAFAQLNDADKAALFVLLERAEELLHLVKGGTLSEQEMLQIAVELEQKFRKVHTTYTLLFQEVSMKKMFDKLARADENHLAGLKERINRFNGEPPAGES